MDSQMQQSGLDTIALLNWYVENGVDEAVADSVTDWTRVQAKTPTAEHKQQASSAPQTAAVASSAPQAAAATIPLGTHEALAEARQAASAAKTLDDLRAALEGFEGLSLKRTATQMVFADGVAGAKVMFVGEAPGTDEDKVGKPFVGEAGQLFDHMLSFIGLNRAENIYISNILNWRPPGNRSPSDAEIAISLPFVRRHIELANPDVLVFVGGVAAKALLETTQGITRLRGNWVDYKLGEDARTIPALPVFHPGFLLRNPAQKAAIWQDLLALKNKLSQI